MATLYDISIKTNLEAPTSKYFKDISKMILQGIKSQNKRGKSKLERLSPIRMKKLHI